MPERGRKSPMSIGPMLRSRMSGSVSSVVTLPQSIDMRQQRSNSTPDDDDLNLTLILTEAALSNPTNLSNTPTNRHSNFDLHKHPYTISLDHSKDSLVHKDYHSHSRDHVAREQLARDHLSRDPLKELRDNSRESGRPLKQEPQEVAVTRRSKSEISNWMKPKYSDDLSLPSVSGGK